MAGLGGSCTKTSFPKSYVLVRSPDYLTTFVNFHTTQLHIKLQHYLHYPVSTVQNGRGHDPFVPLRHVCRTKARFIREHLVVAQFTWDTNCSGVNTFPAKNTVHRTAHCTTDEMTAAGSLVPCEQLAAHSVCAQDTLEKSHRGLGLDNRGNCGSIPSTRKTFFYSPKRPDQLRVTTRFLLVETGISLLWGKMAGAWSLLHNSV